MFLSRLFRIATQWNCEYYYFYLNETAELVDHDLPK